MSRTERRWPVIEGDFVSGNKRDLVVVQLLQKMLASGASYKRVEGLARKRGVILVK